MRSFWGFYDNGTYRVGCNGGTLYIYDQNDNELAKFKDIKYAYVGSFKPGTNIFLLKSTEGSLAVYDLDTLQLIKKIVITRIGAQDEGFSFTPDGSYFYNIEKPINSCRTQLTKYCASNFQVSNVFFSQNIAMVLVSIEFAEDSDIGYVLGFMRNSSGVFDYGFIGKFINDEIVDIKKIPQHTYDYISAYKSYEASGFTKRTLEGSRIKYYADKPSISLKEAYDKL